MPDSLCQGTLVLFRWHFRLRRIDGFQRALVQTKSGRGSALRSRVYPAHMELIRRRIQALDPAVQIIIYEVALQLAKF